MTKTIKKQFTIDGMHCSSCSLDIDFDLEELDGVVSANTNYARQKSEVTYDPMKVSEKEIIELVEKKGYTMTTSE